MRTYSFYIHVVFVFRIIYFKFSNNNVYAYFFFFFLIQCTVINLIPGCKFISRPDFSKVSKYIYYRVALMRFPSYFNNVIIYAYARLLEHEKNLFMCTSRVLLYYTVIRIA